MNNEQASYRIHKPSDVICLGKEKETAIKWKHTKNKWKK